MPLMQLIYASRPFGFDDLALSGILATARRNNVRDDITGALICREDLYVQLLEGPGALIEATYERIKRDDRHTDVERKVLAAVEVRLFPDWAMRHDPAQSWLWSREQVSSGGVDAASAEDFVAIFRRLAIEPAAEPVRCPMSRA